MCIVLYYAIHLLCYALYSVCFSYTRQLPAYTYNYTHMHTCMYIGMCRNHSGRLLASYSHDNRVRFWDLSLFVDDVGGEEEGEEEGEGHNSDLKPAAFSEEVDGEEAAMIADEDEGEGEGDEEGAWEDMDSESDDEEEEEESSSSDDNNDHGNLDVGGDNDSSDEDSDSDNNGNSNIKGKKGNNKSYKYQNATEKFYADL